MDSGNSGSLQSSSGGDEEYDPRTESISAFLNPSSHIASLSNPSHHHHHQTHPPPAPSSSSSLFDYLDSYSRSPAAAPSAASSLLNLDMVWPRGLRSEPTCTEIPTGGLMGSSSPAQSALGSQTGPFQGSSATLPLYTSAKNGARPLASSSSDQTNPVRNSKKRSRASRRAPTTVLTTDTSNFRAMVQEFTGIPAPPFSASPFPRNRFDLFSTASTTMRSSHLEPTPPPYLLRPFAQKFHAPPSSASTTSSNPSVTTSGAVTTTAVGSTNHHQLFSDLGFTKQTQSLINMQNPIFTFQSLLQASGPPPTAPPPRYPLANVPVFGSKSQGLLSDPSQLRMGTTTTTMVEDFTMSNHGLPSLVNNNNNNNNSDPSSWGDGMGLNGGDHSQSQSQAQAQTQLKSFNGNYGSSQQQRGSSNCKMNYSTSSLEFQVEKGSENVSSRGEGMVDSWLCSSD